MPRLSYWCKSESCRPIKKKKIWQHVGFGYLVRGESFGSDGSKKSTNIDYIYMKRVYLLHLVYFNHI